MTQDRAKAPRERESLLLIDRDLDNPGELILDRIFDRDEFIFFDVHLGDGGIERRGFSAARRTSDKYHPIGLRDGSPEPLEVLVIEPEALQAQGRHAGTDRFAVQNTDDDRLTEHARQNQYPEIDGLPFKP